MENLRISSSPKKKQTTTTKKKKKRDPLSVEIPETTTKTNEEDLAGEKEGGTGETIQTTNKTKTVWTKPPSPARQMDKTDALLSPTKIECEQIEKDNDAKTIDE